MNIEELRAYCLQKKETSEAFPFDEDTLVFKVCGKMFALTSLKKWEAGDPSVNLKCDPERAVELREQYPDDIFPGYHMSKVHWNTVNFENASLSPKQLIELIDHSYEMVVNTLPKKDRKRLIS
ncbi:MmcQ/YjbR family DNA-binding protein [Mesonia sp. K7]|uniref:MmcQ/YjbR family DNA-binding protein n=1 Tax=Mesonia sp. K7 TaxID=2218606 RepID=UPI000DA90BA9|nr:MmcQ/YjbR family DNA-binding protein [Mesonia sp. K7]PZD79602.1 MmcQ/YjbR family DNA-binding protein [Mesonia sp. K7]